MVRIPHALWLLLVLPAVGCQSSWFDWTDMPGLSSFANAEEDDFEEEEKDEFVTKADTPFIGEYTTVAGLNMITLEGVGLVTGLDGTGGDPPPSGYRTALLEQMRKRGVTNPNEWLSRPDTALVVVRADFPPLVKPGDEFDVKVRLPEGSKATSLQGGWLLETYLAEAAVVPGRGMMKGHVFAKAKGPVLVSAGSGDDEDLAGVLRRGRILGGGESLKSRDMSLFLRSDYRSVRNAKRIADRIGTRFSEYNRHGIRTPLADAKTDQKVELRIHPKYRDNFPRYLHAIRKIPFRETTVARRIRLEQLEDKLNTPATSSDAAIELEAAGTEALPILRTALNNPSLEVRFHAATALAYLGDTSGTKHLADAARAEPAFRVYALAGLAAADDGEAMVLLRSLLDEESAELRYGAFRAMTVIDEYDPYVAGEPLPNKDARQFQLHVLPTAGPPMVHVTTYQKAEIVVFNTNQSFRVPFFARAGKHIVVRGEAGSDTITIARHEANVAKRQQVPNSVPEVIRAAAEMGASYPEVVQMLVQAGQQGNLPGRFEQNALPEAGRGYVRPAEGDNSGSSSTVGNRRTAPNLFRIGEEDDD